MGADVRKYGTEHPKPGSEPSSHQLNNNQTYEGGPAVALYLWHYSYSWPSGTTKKPESWELFYHVKSQNLEIVQVGLTMSLISRVLGWLPSPKVLDSIPQF